MPDTPLSTTRSLLRLLRYARFAVPRLIWGTVTALAAALVTLSIPLALEAVVGGPIASGEFAAIVWGALAVLGLGLLEVVLTLLRRLLLFRPANRIEYLMRTDIYVRLQRLPVAFHDRWQSGQLLSRMMQDIGTIRRWISFGLIVLVVNVLTIVIGAVLLFRWHWILGVVFLLTGVPMWIHGFVFKRNYGELTRRSQDQSGDLATSVEESAHGIRVLKAFGRGGHALRRFRAQAEELRRTELDKAVENSRMKFLLDFMPQLAFGLSLLAGFWLIAQGAIDVAELFAFFAMMTMLRWPIESLGFLFSSLLDARTATDRVFEVLDEPDPIHDPDDPATLEDPRGELRFDGVRFRFPDARPQERDVLDGIDLTVRPGETMALVGLTGCGKTTLSTLPARLYDVTGGRVLLDGVDVRRLRLAELRTHVAMAFEDATLFSATVRENVLLGCTELDLHGPEADAVLREALEVAQAGFVDDLPDGVETGIGEEGLSLSGGQRQRLALARAVAARPRVLVLDDPLSALDVDTEARVTSRLREVLHGTTTLVIAHRPSTVALADRVALMGEGRILAVGTHSELLRGSSDYRHVISNLEDDYSQHDAARAEAVSLATGAIAVHTAPVSLPDWEAER